MLIPHDTLIAVIDGEHFELFRNSGNEAEPLLSPQTAPRLDAENHSGTSHRSRPGNHADSLVEEDAHAAAAAHWLNSELDAHRVARLAVIAPPRTLGELRKHYSKALQQSLLCELDKDFVGRPGPDVLAALRSVK